MPVNNDVYRRLMAECAARKVTLVAVSKTKPISDILELYNLGHRDFGENYVQELTQKQPQLPPDVRWHFIGHLQSNKVKFLAPFVHLIHAVDSLKLLREIDRLASKNNRVVRALLQVHIAREETKFGFDEQELEEITVDTLRQLPNTEVVGLMGMASLTKDMEAVRQEFRQLKKLYDALAAHLPQLNTLSMGMSADYAVAIDEGGNMVRIGSLLFGARQ